MADAKDIMLHREVSARIGKSRLYDAALSCAQRVGSLEQVREDDGMRCESYRMPRGETWGFISLLPTGNTELER